jgi:ABC-type amino acid transport substrate-binding protein
LGKRIIAAALLVAASALPLSAEGAHDPSAPFNDHELVAVHRIHQREQVRIGVIEDDAPWSYVDAKGVWQGYDVYFARRIAREILGDKEKYLRLVPVNRENWVEHLVSGKADIVLGIGSGGEQADNADFALPYRRDGDALIAPAVRKGNDELVLWLDDVINRRVEDDFFHKDYEATLRQVYSGIAGPDAVVIERGKVE